MGECEQRGVSQDVIQLHSDSVYIGFLASEGQLKVRRLIASAVVDSCSDYIVETFVMRER